jgi:Domain of unknown function (DUF4112)
MVVVTASRAGDMATVRKEETQAEMIAHVMDDCIRLPNSAMRFGIDPLIGIIPVFGDALATTIGISIILFARRLGAPLSALLRMGYNLLINGAVGAVPVFGDAFSFWYKCHAKNAALLLKAVAQGEGGACQLIIRPFKLVDFIIILLLALPIIVIVGYFDWWLWEHQFSIF